MNLGNRLTELRKSKQLSQEDVAFKLNVTRQTVSKWETDQSQPDFDKITPLCELYGITPDELLTGAIKDKREVLPENDDNKKKRTLGLIIGIFGYFLAVSFIMISTEALKFSPVISAAIFMLIVGLATCIIIYTSIMYKKKKEESIKEENSLYKTIDEILGIVFLIIYLGISFVTMAWHITWIVWLIYAVVTLIVKLILSLRGEKNEK